MREWMRQGRRSGAALGVVACLLIAGVERRGEAAAPPAGPPSESPPREVQHQVGPGQNLHLIAGYYYGDARQWERVWQLNRAAIRNPNRIDTGMMLRIPVERHWKPDVPFDDWAKRVGELRPRQVRAIPPRAGAPPTAVPPAGPPPAAAPVTPGPPPPPPPGKAPAKQPAPAKAPAPSPPAPPAKKTGASAPITPSLPKTASAMR